MLIYMLSTTAGYILNRQLVQKKIKKKTTEIIDFDVDTLGNFIN